MPLIVGVGCSFKNCLHGNALTQVPADAALARELNAPGFVEYMVNPTTLEYDHETYDCAKGMAKIISRLLEIKQRIRLKGSEFLSIQCDGSTDVGKQKVYWEADQVWYDAEIANSKVARLENGGYAVSYEVHYDDDGE